MRRPALAVVVATLASCAVPRAVSPIATNDTWRFDVYVPADAKHLEVTASFAREPDRALVVDGRARPFVRDVVTACDGGRCTTRYRFELDEAARATHDSDVAASYDGAYVAPGSAWLLHPNGVTPRAYVLDVRSGGPRVLAAVHGEVTGAGVVESPLFGFGRWRVGLEGSIELGIAPGARAMNDDAINRWTVRSLAMVTGYLRASPVPRPLVLVAPGQGDAIDGKTLGGGGGSILLQLGSDVTPTVASESWVLVHEMIHLEMPSLGPPHEWLEEGLATYLEPIIRARAGAIPAERVWIDWARDAPQGQPAPGDEGLERTHGWERTYWGGAIFCLAADVEIRKRTGNGRSLDDAMRAIAQASRGVADHWTIDRFLATGDAATGVPVLRELYARLALAPGRVDIEALWRDLGVAPDGERVTFDDRAPLADIRRTMLAP